MFDRRTASTKGPGPIHPTAELAAAVSLGNLERNPLLLVAPFLGVSTLCYRVHPCTNNLAQEEP